MELMVLNSETKLPEPHPALLLISCFNKLMKRIRPIDGDRNGSKKIMNMKELGYIYFWGRYDSRFRLMKDTDKEKKIRQLLNIPDEWIADELVRECLELYKDSQWTASSALVLSLEGTEQAMATYMNLLKDRLTAGTLEPKEVKEIQAIIDGIPTMIDNVRRARDTVHKEINALATGRNGRQPNKFELT
jgi:hypothetical protein